MHSIYSVLTHFTNVAIHCQIYSQFFTCVQLFLQGFPLYAYIPQNFLLYSTIRKILYRIRIFRQISRSFLIIPQISLLLLIALQNSLLYLIILHNSLLFIIISQISIVTHYYLYCTGQLTKKLIPALLYSSGQTISLLIFPSCLGVESPVGATSGKHPN